MLICYLGQSFLPYLPQSFPCHDSRRSCEHPGYFFPSASGILRAVHLKVDVWNVSEESHLEAPCLPADLGGWEEEFHPKVVFSLGELKSDSWTLSVDGSYVIWMSMFCSCGSMDIPGEALLCFCLAALHISSETLMLFHLRKTRQRYLEMVFPTSLIWLWGAVTDLKKPTQEDRIRGWLWISSCRKGYLYNL